MKRYLFKLNSFFLVVMLISCATKQPPVPPKEAIKKPNFAFIQITDRAQISYAELPCSIFFTDGSIQQTKTDVEGKIFLDLGFDKVVLKVVYDFKNYKRQRGRFLAKEDFRFSKKVKTKKNSMIQEFNLNFKASEGAKTILILDIF